MMTTQTLLSKIRNKLSLVTRSRVFAKKNPNFHKLNLMSTMVQVAYLKADKKTLGVSGDLLEQLKGAGWELLTTSFDHDLTHQYGYKSVVFINRKTKEIHIANAGTQLSDWYDLWDNFKLIFNTVPNKLKPAKQLVSATIKLIGGVDRALEYTFSSSGHSLGAIQSDLIAAEILSRKLPFQQSATFENPGSFAVVKRAIKKGYLSGEITLESVQEHCREYNAKRNFINTLKQRLGNSVHLVVFQRDQAGSTTLPGTSPSMEALDFLGLGNIKDSIGNHKMENFREMGDHNTFQVSPWNDTKGPIRCINLPGTRPVDQVEGEFKEQGDWLILTTPRLLPAMTTFSPKNSSHPFVAKALHAINPETRSRVGYPLMDSRNW